MTVTNNTYKYVVAPQTPFKGQVFEKADEITNREYKFETFDKTQQEIILELFAKNKIEINDQNKSSFKFVSVEFSKTSRIAFAIKSIFMRIAAFFGSKYCELALKERDLEYKIGIMSLYRKEESSLDEAAVPNIKTDILDDESTIKTTPHSAGELNIDFILEGIEEEEMSNRHSISIEPESEQPAPAPPVQGSSRLVRVVKGVDSTAQGLGRRLDSIGRGIFQLFNTNDEVPINSPAFTLHITR